MQVIDTVPRVLAMALKGRRGQSRLYIQCIVDQIGMYFGHLAKSLKKTTGMFNQVRRALHPDAW